MHQFTGLTQHVDICAFLFHQNIFIFVPLIQQYGKHLPEILVHTDIIPSHHTVAAESAPKWVFSS